jgi:glucose 1-dehydrogenase
LTYAASKAALRMLTESLAVELGPRRIRVNAIAPGAIATDINRDVIARIGPARFAELIPLGRIGTVDDITGPAVFLCSRAAAYVTGATLVVDGAYSHHLVRYRDDAGVE